MKAVILLAGVGSRLHPLTLDRPKSLLPIGDSTVLEHMVSKLQRQGISSFVIVCGHMQEVIKAYVAETFPDLDVTFVTNDKYLTTNTGYSLLIAKEQLDNESFIKLDGDVIFDEEIVKRLLAADGDVSYVCTDNTSVDDEVIKVICDQNGDVLRIGNKLAVSESIGESIGIERISKQAARVLFTTLQPMMKNVDNYQNYYEVAYDEIIRAGAHFKTVDITGLRWVEMDNLEDYQQAQAYFANTKP
jgi:choline kinase